MIEKSYIETFEIIKKQIQISQHKTILNANKEMISLYWSISKMIDAHSK